MMTAPSQRARRLAQALASMFEPSKPAPLPKLLLRRIPVTSSDCPLPGCETCPPSVLDREINRVAWWLITAYPDCWYFEDPAAVRDVAGRLVQLRADVAAGMVKG